LDKIQEITTRNSRLRLGMAKWLIEYLIKFIILGKTINFREPAAAFLLTRKEIDSIYLFCSKRKPMQIILFIFFKKQTEI